MTSLLGALSPCLPPGWVRFETTETVERAFDSCDNPRGRDELLDESNRLREALPVGAHPTAGAPFVYLEDESR